MVETQPKLLIIVPSRERPHNALRLLSQIHTTTPNDAEIYVTFAVDSDDPTLYQYPDTHTQDVEGGNMVKALNEVAVEWAPDYEYIAFLGDDTLPQGNWYAKIMEALQSKKNAVVYGNDLIHGAGLPTSVFMDSNIVRCLGFMAPPNQQQLYVDNYWKALGEKLGTLTYVPDAIIEHLHPLAGKSENDAVYDARYTTERWNADKKAFSLYMAYDFYEDVDKIK